MNSAPTVARVSAPRPMLLAAFAFAIALRVWFAAELPMISRDGVTFVDYAKRLDARGISAIRDADFDQHPLFPATIAAVHRVLVGFLGQDSPLVWQRSGQIVALLCGGAVLLMIGALASRVVRTLSLPVNADHVAAIAVLLAGLLPLNVWLSADVMSEPLFLVFYLGSCAALCRVYAWTGLISGLLAGAAFLTRPEAVAIIPGILVGAFHRWRTGDTRNAIAIALLGLLGFCAVAGPYWIALGQLSPKADKRTVSGPVEMPAVVARAQLRTTEVPMIAAPWLALVEVARAGRIVILLLAVPALIRLRAEILRSPLISLAAIVIVHFVLISLLRYRHGYLDPRHTLVIMELLIPLAAIAAAYLLARKSRWVGMGALVGVCAPLLVYAARIPDEQNRHLLPAAIWAKAHASDASKALLGPASHSRIAFYSGVRFVVWRDEASTVADRLASLRESAIRERVALISMEVGPPHAEDLNLAGNLELLTQLTSDGLPGATLRTTYDEPTGDGARLVILEVFWE